MTSLVGIIGTDGSGKTTLSAALVEELRRSGTDARHEWLGAESYLMAPVRRLLRLVWGRRRAKQSAGTSGYREEVSRKNEVVRRFSWATSAYVTLILLDYRIQLRRKLRRTQGCDVIVADRYIFDVAVNLALVLGWDRESLVEFLQRQLTRVKLPDVRVFLRVEPEVSLARKDDIPDIDYLRLRLSYYDAVASAFGFEVRDGSQPAAETASWMVDHVRVELARPHIHYVHSNNVDVGGADKVLVRMAEHMGPRHEGDRHGGFRVSVSLRLPTEAVRLHQAAGTPVLLREFVRPQLSSGVKGLLRFSVTGPIAYLYFRRLFALQRPNIVHVNDVYDFIPAVAARHAGVPAVHHLRMFQGRAPVRRLLARVISGNSVASVSVSHAVRDHYFPREVAGHRATTIYDLGDASLMVDQGDVRVAGPRPAEVPGGGLLVAMVGRIEEWKGQSVFLDAVEALGTDVRQRIRCVLVGGPVPGKEGYYEDVEQRAAELGVDMLGARSDVPAILRACDISVHCSTEPDPFPGVVVESLLSGAATVGADAGGVPEMINDSAVGVLVRPGRADLLAGAIRELVDDEQSPRARFAKSGRVRGLTLVDPANIDSAMAALYQDVLSRSKSTGRP